MSMQKICVVYGLLPGNHLKIRKVTPFGLQAQKRPANAGVLQPVSMIATGGCLIDV